MNGRAPQVVVVDCGTGTTSTRAMDKSELAQHDSDVKAAALATPEDAPDAQLAELVGRAIAAGIAVAAPGVDREAVTQAAAAELSALWS